MSLASKAQLESTALVLWHADGTNTEIALFKRPNISFSGGKVFVTSDVLNLEYDAADVVRFTYKGATTSISSVITEADYEYQGDCIVFQGIKGSDRVAIYNAAGVRVPVSLRTMGGGQVIQLSSLPAGVYILSVNAKSSKFTKR